MHYDTASSMKHELQEVTCTSFLRGCLFLTDSAGISLFRWLQLSRRIWSSFFRRSPRRILRNWKSCWQKLFLRSKIQPRVPAVADLVKLATRQPEVNVQLPMCYGINYMTVWCEVMVEESRGHWMTRSAGRAQHLPVTRLSETIILVSVILTPHSSYASCRLKKLNWLQLDVDDYRPIGREPL